MKMLISLSILEYEPDLSNYVGNLAKSKAFSKIIRAIQTGKICNVHIDVMRRPIVPNTKFSIGLIKNLYEELHEKTNLVLHLMVKEPFPIVEKINGFIPNRERIKTGIIIQVESFSSEDETVKALRLLKEYGYKAGICLNLPTPRETLTDKIVENAEIVLLMSVPMGRGGQEYSDEATKRIMDLSQRFPDKIIEVDGGIDLHTGITIRKAGAKVAIVGSFITRNENPEEAILKIEKRLENVDVT